ncbi:putative damage-inducible protein DinB [Saccharothrix ecbatanensis]|uniref:Putative damage-inducible protein DinB n=1 Tax=Saccharothrix ecbatanensis TaxID=1105145 RepID=A0A7W9HJH1_9PSEU|nr:DinB family protein [Saccharothrix ecbatanensis]MBB5803437.1 putative damage-inducible protein DinB [Saccharothrix ecbatanensis]
MTDGSSALPRRAFGWEDVWVGPEADPREAGGLYSGERQTLVRYLRDRRLTLEMKCAGLDAEGMARRSVPPSDLSLLGLVRHLAEVEQYWFRRVLTGEDVPPHYTSATVAFGETTADPEEVEDAWATWRSEVAFAERFVAEAPDLDVLGGGNPEYAPVPLREVLIHMIEEYARHNGHADLIRERIDGRVGQ